MLGRIGVLTLTLQGLGLASMTNVEGGSSNPAATEDAMSVHNFTEKILEQVVHFHVMKMKGGFFLWVGLSNLQLCASSPLLRCCCLQLSSSKYDSMPMSTLVLGDPSDTMPNSLSQRLAKKTKKQVFVSYNLPAQRPTSLYWWRTE
ncbi:hypothetical protein AAFF_G00031610 [Aldrovandia affinis]|uniref:Uncharacterized protein n=1 Tax=Aldrovandia affinis TaxID=143900 RepID=A0AAD7WFU1_9TELE|nr:hypothetical protein AAFF_G00031610 [Aldrovandia affinis]